MSHGIMQQIAHGLHVAHQTKEGKAAIHAATTGALTVATVVLGPVAGPVVLGGFACWGVWKLLKS
jgi:hypothetical protein